MTKVAIPNTPIPQTLALFDKPIAEAQTILKTELAWLNYSFGKTQILVKERNGRPYNYPGVYITDNQYEDLHPNTEFGNYSFFVVDTTQDINDFRPNSFNELKAECSIIFWLDLSQIYTDSPDRAIEVIKAEILEVLTRKFYIKTGRFTFTEIEEKAEDIYKETDLAEIETQFLMQPYCGLRFNSILTISESC